jgi:hypothetical protein
VAFRKIDGFSFDRLIKNYRGNGGFLMFMEETY